MYIAGTRRGITCKELAFHLRDCEGGYSIPDSEEFIVNYGRTDLSYRANLNANLISNKLTQLQMFKASGLPTPETFEIRDDIPFRYFPLIARKYHHYGGTDAIVVGGRRSYRRKARRIRSRDYFVSHIPKSQEFRVHVLGDEVVGISTKVKSNDTLNHSKYIWSRKRGWIQVDYNGELYDRLSELGRQALRSLSYDFGAVDVILGTDGILYLLEVNSAPRLNRRRRKLYTKYFRKKQREYTND